MKKTNDMLSIDEGRYDTAVATVRGTLGSYHQIATAVHDATGELISYNTIRNHFKNRTVPVELAAVFQDLTMDEVTVSDFYPWLEKYFQPVY